MASTEPDEERCARWLGNYLMWCIVLALLAVC